MKRISILVACVIALLAAPTAQAQTFTVLWPFTGVPGPAYSYGSLVQDSAGNLYGATFSGGVGGSCFPSTPNCGTVFAVEADNDVVLYDFAGGKDGANPAAGLIMDADGNLYGTTLAGGEGTECIAHGCGVVFKLKAGQETVLYRFIGGTKDGCNSYGSLAQDAAHNLYGTTYACGAYNEGTVFKLSASGQETVLHSFDYSDRANPNYTSLLVAKGNLYGVAFSGGVGFGTVYKLTEDGKFTLLHSFTCGTDGGYPAGTPTMDADGNLYGTANACGSSNNGVVWEISADGHETVLHNFAGGTSDGANPYAGVIMDEAGNLYGTTDAGGSSDLGTVYELNKNGTLTLLHSFAETDGENPWGGVIRDSAGHLYGTTVTGGSGGYGTVWKLTP